MSKETEADRLRFWKQNLDLYIPCVSIDCVIFGYHDKELKILLTTFDNFDKWLLPGGFILKNESIDDAAKSILKYKSGLKDVYLRQFQVFGEVERTNNCENLRLLEAIDKDKLSVDMDRFGKRHLSIGYYAFVDFTKVEITPLGDEKIEWVDHKEIPELYLDHKHIVQMAKNHIKQNVLHVPIGYALLPEKFTMTDLRNIYEIVLGTELDRRNFQRKILSTGHVVRTNEMSIQPGVRPTNLFSFDMDAYIKDYPFLKKG